MNSPLPRPALALPPSFSSREFRNALGMFATGVTIVTARNAAGELVGPTAELVVARDVAVRQRIAQRHDAADIGARQHVDAAEEIPVVNHAGGMHDLVTGEVTGRR